MIDIQLVRNKPEFVKEKSKQKGYDVDVDKMLQLDLERRELLQTVEQLRARRNEIAESMKQSGGKPDDAAIEEGKQIKLELAEREKYLTETESKWLELLKSVPNMPLDQVPVGASEDENQVIRQVGQKPEFDFEPLNHAQIAEKRGWLDKDRAAKVTGSRFAYIKGDLAKLHFAILQFGIDILTDQNKLTEIAQGAGLDINTRPFTLVLPPLMIRTEAYDAMDRLEPREDRYKIEGEELWLQGSAEHVLGSMHSGEIFDEKDLPIRYAGYATSFRKEAGTYGKDMEGIIRMHQFDKLEMESLTTADQSLNEHLFMIAIQEYLMQQLGLPYQVVEKCTADIGKPNAKGVDIDVWLPGQAKYRETHTADYMADYQARRLQTRVRREENIELIHTNDATAFSQRPLIAILENFQTKDAQVQIPEILRPYMGGREII